MPEDGPRSQPRILGVSELTRRIRLTLEEEFGQLWVEGELSNVRRPASGHIYLTLKDENAQISGVLFRGNQRGMTFLPQDGQRVRVQGEITVYERGGNYQILIRRMEEAGKGTLQAQFEALKETLRLEGLFDDTRKQPMPLLARHVGVVTSRTGAAIRDILNVLTRRFPDIHLLLAPVKVQGPGAAEEIAAAIDQLNAVGGLDVLIVGRGGGSLEDLWCFNEEVVARAIARSAVPVLSAVGHEIDFTISDFVADLRAPTPSAAAELVVGRKEDFETHLAQRSDALRQLLQHAVIQQRLRLNRLADSYVFREPGNLVRQYRQKLDLHAMRTEHALTGRRDGDMRRLESAAARLETATHQRLDRAKQVLLRFQTHLQAISPLAVLGRGYSLTTDDAGRVVQDASALELGATLHTRLSKGSASSTVATIHKEEG